jgi:hypothetical protein
MVKSKAALNNKMITFFMVNTPKLGYLGSETIKLLRDLFALNFTEAFEKTIMNIKA